MVAATVHALPAPRVAGLLAQPRANSLRVEWCERAWSLLRANVLADAPETAAVTVGFPQKGARGSKHKRVGECWSGWQGGEGYFVSLHPCLFPDPLKVLETLLHEQVHAAVGLECGHKGAFVRQARAVGLEGKPTATYAGEALKARLYGLSDRLGALPPGFGDVESPSRERGRMRKYECPCGQIIRAATDTLDATHNGCGGKFVKA